jgi:hypothetical protein
MDKEAYSQIADAMIPWIDSIRSYPGFTEWKQRSIRHIMDYGEAVGFEEEPASDPGFHLPPHLEKQHDAIMAFLSLAASYHAMAATQYYFRRYPFKDFPVSREDHIRYTCEAFFSRVYEFSERLKKCLNSFNAVIPGKLDVGGTIKIFAKDFKHELKARNQIHHHERFDEIQLSKVALFEILALGDKLGEGSGIWDERARRAYRAVSREWAERSKKRSDRAKVYLNAVAQAYLEHAYWLKEPVANDTVEASGSGKPQLLSGPKPGS